MSEQQATQIVQLMRAIAYFDTHKTTFLPVFFNPELFPSDPHTVSEAQALMVQTLNQLEQAQGDVAQFLAEKFIGQFHALVAVLNIHTSHTTTSPTPATQLSPRERLNTYYKYLAQLKTKLEAQQNAQLNVSSPQWQEHIKHTQKRIIRCQAAIEQLEEYLVFAKQREEDKSAV